MLHKSGLKGKKLGGTTFITIEVPANHPQLISGMEGGKQHHEEVMKANKEGLTKVQKKKLEGQLST